MVAGPSRQVRKPARPSKPHTHRAVLLRLPAGDPGAHAARRQEEQCLGVWGGRAGGTGERVWQTAGIRALIPAWWDCWEAEKLMCVMFFFLWSSLLFRSWRSGVEGEDGPGINASTHTDTDTRTRALRGMPSTFEIGALPVLDGR